MFSKYIICLVYIFTIKDVLSKMDNREYMKQVFTVRRLVLFHKMFVAKRVAGILAFLYIVYIGFLY
jgi:hypothetical protein